MFLEGCNRYLLVLLWLYYVQQLFSLLFTHYSWSRYWRLNLIKCFWVQAWLLRTDQPFFVRFFNAQFYRFPQIFAPFLYALISLLLSRNNRHVRLQLFSFLERLTQIILPLILSLLLLPHLFCIYHLRWHLFTSFLFILQIICYLPQKK